MRGGNRNIRTDGTPPTSVSNGWYPKKSRTDRLTARFDLIARTIGKNLDVGPDRIAHVSGSLTTASGRPDFPRTQIGRWLWIASQYRIYGNQIAGATAAAALMLLDDILALDSIDEEAQRDLNWILETAVARLVAMVGPDHLRGCLSAAELERIDEFLFEDNDERFDRETVEPAARERFEELQRSLSIEEWSGLGAKVDALFTAAARPGPANAPARAALCYLAQTDDVVDDGLGILGLVDDVYVLEWAYAAIESQTLCLPLLESMTARRPFVASLGLGADGAQLDRFGRYVVCAALQSLELRGLSVLVLREPGPYPIIAAVAAAVAAAAEQATTFDEDLELWQPNCPVIVSDGNTTFHARWGGRIEGAGRPLFRLHVADSGSISLGEELLPYLSQASRDWKRLSGGSQIATWVKDRNVDALTGLTGRGRRRPARHEAVLLLTRRSDLDLYLDAMRPQGVTPAALLGACWTDSHGRRQPLPGSATDRPLIYACGDVATACELIADPPEHISGWRVIVDGGRASHALRSALSASGRDDELPLCCIAGLHEQHEVSALLSESNADAWYLEDQDVEIPPSTHPDRSEDDNPLSRFFARNASHWTAVRSIRLCSPGFLDEVAECLRRCTERERGDPAMDALDLSVSSFLQRATLHPLPCVEDRTELARLASDIRAQAATLAVYERSAADVRDLFSRFCVDEIGGERREALLKLAGSLDMAEAVAVLCRSRAAAESCRRSAKDTGVLDTIEWTTIEGLRRAAPFDRIVVPTWLGRRTMRELSNVGFGARTDMLLLPFEQRWYERTIVASGRWERRLERSTVRLLEGFMRKENDRIGNRWYEQALRRVELAPANDAGPLDDTPETRIVETRAIESIGAALSGSGGRGDTVKAQLVLFQDPGSFALLPPGGQVIVLPEEVQDRTVGESQLFVTTASLSRGMLTALPLHTDRDLIDAWADRAMNDGGATRRRADRWKAALKRHFNAGMESHAGFARRLREAGEARDPATIRSWANDTRSVAPRNYRRMLPLIATLTDDPVLLGAIEDSIAAIDAIYDARALAADAILHEIFAGSMDLSEKRLSVDVEGHRLVYALARVDRLAGVRDVPAEFVGRRLLLGDLPAREGEAA